MTYTAFLHKTKLTIATLLSAAGLTYANADTTNTESSNSSEPKEINEALPVADSTKVAEVDSTVANFNEEKEKLAQKEETEGGNPPEYETQNFAIDNDRVMPKESASAELSETCNRVNRYRILREGLSKTYKKISKNTNLTPNEASYMVGRMINASDGTAMDEADKLTPTGKKFLEIYDVAYNEALKKGKIMVTIEINYRTGMQGAEKSEAFEKYMKRVNGSTGEVNPKMEEFEKYELSQGLFFMITNTDWESVDFTNSENIIDWNKIKSLGETIPVAYTILLEGGKYGNSWENIVKYAAKINSMPGYEPESEDNFVVKGKGF